MMTRKLLQATLVGMLCLTVPSAYGEGRGKEPERGGKAERKPESKPGGKPGEKPGEKPGAGRAGNEGPGREAGGKPMPNRAGTEKNSPGGDWNERTHGGKQTNAPIGAAGLASQKNKGPQPTAAEGAAAGAAAANRNQPKVSGAEGAAAGAAAANNRTNAAATEAAAGYAAVRNSFDHPNMYGHEWYGNHPNAWVPTGWAAGAAWTPATWSSIAAQGGYGNSAPTTYNYGGNVTNQGGRILVDTEDIGTAAEFSQQAARLAQQGIDADVSGTKEWLPLGVFAMVRNETQQPQVILQLAINEAGILRGNYTDEVAGLTLPILGAVDKQTQRAAWTMNGNTQSVTEAGLHNLTESEAPALLHRNGKTSHWILVRLQQPKTTE